MIADIACVFGWTEAECLGKPLDRLMSWHRRALERAPAHLRRPAG